MWKTKEREIGGGKEGIGDGEWRRGNARREGREGIIKEEVIGKDRIEMCWKRGVTKRCLG